jgi:CRISPR-associated protein Csb1
MSNRFDGWLEADGPVALVIREYLDPVSGPGAVFFPPTFAPPEDQKGEKPSYVIDENKVCLVDSVGSQGNRLEPLFKRPGYAALVPQVMIVVGERKVNLLDAGHRAADAIVRFSGLWPELKKAFLAYRDQGDARQMAQIAPTSLVFGAWDSRDTQAKIPRLVESTIRAYGVERLTRSAQYNGSVGKDDLSDEYPQDFLSGQGMADSPSGRAPGGVIARDGIRREATLNLIALRALGAGSNEETRKLQRYILGLALIAFLAPAELYLRQGCLLVGSQEKLPEKTAVRRDGSREILTLAEPEAVSFAGLAAAEFNVGASREVAFDPDVVKKAFEDGQKKDKKKGKK